ncbi:MAG: ARPP-1 family domain-containing protein, partial [Planctomycetota bacterium]
MPRIPQVLYCLVAACALFACGCGSDGEKQRTVVRLDENHFLGEPVAVSNLTVWPVFADSVQEIGPFLTLKEAEEKQLAAVRENPAGGDVGTLVIENTGDVPVLVLAGTVVTGGKQDRQIGQDFVVQAGSTVPVDAFCVERGRWSAQRKGEATNGKFKVAGVVATAPVRGAGQHEKNQGKVWDSVEEICVIFSETIRP